MARTRDMVAGVALFSLVATALVAALPALSFAYRNPELHIALQTAEALIAFLAAFLMLGRFRRRRRLMDLLMCLGLSVLALANLLFSVLPSIFGGDETVATWASLITRLLGAALFAASALAPDRRVRLSKRQELTLAGALVVLVVLIRSGVELFERNLPLGVQALPSDSYPHLDAHWAILAAQLIGCVLYAVAAVGFTRRYETSQDRLLPWLAVGAVLSAAARLNYFLYPSLFSDYVYTGDVFRLAFYLVILSATAAEIRAYWREAAASAALEERRRIARDLHDGMAQELASIQRNLRWLDPDDRFVARATASAERALAQARRAIVALTSDADALLVDALAETARVVGEREDIAVVLDVDAAADIPLADREALVLIASEAITNAARHADTDLVRVELSGDGPVLLRIRDFGRGFDISSLHPTGHSGMGLTVMRERAREIGATLRVDSRPGSGTSVEVTL